MGSLGRRVVVWAFTGLFAAALAQAGPPVRLLVSNDACFFQICPNPVPPPTSGASGTPFLIFVVAVDSSGLQTSYTGTVTFTSTDPFAGIPFSYTFLPGDNDFKSFVATLRTLGSQTITVSDPANNLTPAV